MLKSKKFKKEPFLRRGSDSQGWYVLAGLLGTMLVGAVVSVSIYYGLYRLGVWILQLLNLL